MSHHQTMNLVDQPHNLQSHQIKLDEGNLLIQNSNQKEFSSHLSDKQVEHNCSQDNTDTTINASK